jgi:hypothetical protein
MVTRTGFIQDSGFRVRMSSLALALLCLLFCSPLATRHSSVLFAQVPAGTPVQNVNAKWVSDHDSQVYNALAYPGSDIGAQVNAATAASPATGSIVFIPAGSYTYSTPIVLNKPVWLTGSGAYSTRLSYTGSGDGIRVTGLNDSPFRNAGIKGIYLSGTSNAANGIHQIDSIGVTYNDVSVAGFSGAMASCVLFDNHALFNERFYVEDVTTDKCTNHFRFVRTGGTNSFEYSTMYNVHLNLKTGQTGLFLDGSGGSVLLWGGHYQFAFNMDNTLGPSTVIKLTNGSQLARSTASITGEQTYGSGGIFANIDATSVFYSEGVAEIGIQGLTNIIAPGGVLAAVPPQVIVEGAAPFFAWGSSTVQLGTGSMHGYRGIYLIAAYGGANSFRQGYGIDAYFDGTNWKTAADEYANNGILYLNDGVYVIPNTGTAPQTISDANLANYKVGAFSSTGLVMPTSLHCYSSASPAVCNAAPVGSVVIAAGATSVVVDTSAVTANGQILLTEDSSLGTDLGVTCNTQSLLAVGVPKVTARVAGTSFTVGIEVGPTTNPMCLSFSIIN